MTIPFVDLSREPERLLWQIRKRIQSVVKRSNFILGNEVSEFENAFANYLGVKYCVGLASGTDAILLSLRALGIGVGDEVILPAMTFIASVSPLIHLGIKPVLVDITADIPNIDITKIEKAITIKTKAIIPVHLHGHPADMERIMDIAKKYKLVVIEDAAQAHGAQVKRKAGTIGDVGCFSFYPSKNLGAWGDAGALVTENEDIAKQVRLLRDHGQKEKYEHSILGYNSRLDTIQAVVLKSKLSYLDEWNTKRRDLAHQYNKLLIDLPIRLPREKKGVRAIYHVYQIQTKQRDKLHDYLRKQGIGSSYHYPIPIHLQSALKSLGYKKGSFPVSERFATETLSLPMFPYLKKREVRYISDTIHAFFTK